MHLFWEKGYYATSIQDLVDGLNINRASIYSTYGSKYLLFQKALFLYQEGQSKRIADFLYQQLNVRQGLYLLFEEEVDLSLLNKKGCFFVNTFSELANSDSELDEQLLNYRKNFVQVFFNYLQYGVSQGQISPYKDIQVISNHLFINYSGIKTISKLEKSKEELLKIVSTGLSVLD